MSASTSLKKTGKRLAGSAVVTTLLFVVFVVIPFEQSNAVGIPFGGWIANVTYCTCSSNLLLTIVGPAPGNFVFQPGFSILFPYGQIYRPGPAVVGSYVPGGACMMTGKPCFPLPASGTILMIGTSL